MGNEGHTLDTYNFYENDWDEYMDLYNSFDWDVPDTFNRADYLCDRWASDRGKVALFVETEDGGKTSLTYWQLRNRANQLANFLQKSGVKPGDKIVVSLPQSAEAIISHVAIWKLGGVSVPISQLVGNKAFAYRLEDCDAEGCIIGGESLETVRNLPNHDNEMTFVLSVDDDTSHEKGRRFWDTLYEQPREFDNAATRSDDTAMIIYTSGSTGPPKGVVHTHDVLLGHLPAVATAWCNLEVENTVLWVVGDWAWVSFYMPLSTLYYGETIFGYSGRFNPQRTFELIEEYGITSFFVAPTGMRQMKQIKNIKDKYNLNTVRSIVVGSEPVSEQIVNWAQDTFSQAAINTAYGQTEADQIIGECSALEVSRGGTMGKPLPGHEIQIVDPDTLDQAPQGEIGEIALRYEGNPVCMKEYLNRPGKTNNKLRNGLLLTEDFGKMDEDGYVIFQGRKDDVIISSGHRIGPEEIEDTLTNHDVVLDAGVIGIPHEERGEIPKAFIELEQSTQPSAEVKEELKDFVKKELASHKYPREIEFIKELPTTVTGKLNTHELRVMEGLEESDS